MADLVINPADVKDGTDAKIRSGRAGASITRGMALYESDGKLHPAINFGTSVDIMSNVVGISLCDVDDGQRLLYQSEGTIDLGPVLTAGKVYALSDSPGGICPDEDVGAGRYKTVIGVARDDGNLMLSIIYSGVAVG